MGVQYTPWMSAAAGDVAKAVQTRRDTRLEHAKQDLMGRALVDPAALEQLNALDAEAGMRVAEHIRKNKEASTQADMVQREAFGEELESFRDQVAGFPDASAAQVYAQPQLDRLHANYPELAQSHNVPKQFDESIYVESQTLAGANSDRERAGGPGLFEFQDPESGETYMARGQQIWDPVSNKSEVSWASGPDGKPLRAVSATHSPEQAGAVTYAKSREGERGSGQGERERDDINLGLDSAMSVPDLQRARELLDVVSTGGIQKHINDIQEYFGDNSVAVADMGELGTLLATDLMDKFSLMTGVLSESDMRLLQSMSSDTTRSTATNIRLLDNLMRRTERKVLRGLDRAREGGTASEISELERAARDLGLTEKEIKEGVVDPKAAGGAPSEQAIGIETQADYDALPSGAVYVDPDDGKKYRKP